MCQIAAAAQYFKRRLRILEITSDNSWGMARNSCKWSDNRNVIKELLAEHIYKCNMNIFLCHPIKNLQITFTGTKHATHQQSLWVVESRIVAWPTRPMITITTQHHNNIRRACYRSHLQHWSHQPNTARLLSLQLYKEKWDSELIDIVTDYNDEALCRVQTERAKQNLTLNK